MESLAPIFETLMLLCFGLAWPLSILKLWRTKRADGKSLWFLCVIMTGYASGILFKVSSGVDGVIALYILNFCMVAVDLGLCLKYQRSAS